MGFMELMFRKYLPHDKVNCPKCGEPAPQIRTPTSWRQPAWGGWTCASCGCEMDKWGMEITQSKPNA